MNTKYRLVFLIACGLIVWRIFNYFDLLRYKREASVLNEENEKEVITVSIFYETLCSDSRNFILNQLVPTYDELHEHMLLDLIPYGKAKMHNDNGRMSFTCQHGVTECAANKIHACTIDLVTDPRLQLKYLACMIYDNIVPVEALERCGKELGIEYIEIIDCFNTMAGDALLRKNGIRTDAVTPRITFIPTVEFDGALNVKLSLVLKDFRKVLCGLYKTKPNACL